ncbi:FliH/SctL family protein [Variovorax arabinosiphilus]|uniref:FliH/SctL family protein n=1 Tax=Variovorax arabinosiphilus TaxID=3053498 RepID=UPI00257770DC|nr:MULTISPECIES: FliH/SctL family protein [unclassified Variovorax]MDM0122192.1 FliH/SctL family protein [Variovorax sp. J2L1-78]MDM0131279.1 FliH/SctL family protein [Variovorax sp. J2L1-63]MDM0234955.1 FliH/SctL family protein [Variovorax sp. J2R1-6]
MSAAQTRPVLRDVEVRGRFELPLRHLPAPADAALGTAAPKGAVLSVRLVHAEEAHRPTHQMADLQEAVRRAFEDGVVRGRQEAQAQAAEKARQLADETAEQIESELNARTERITLEIAEQSKVSYQARLQLMDGLLAGLPAQIEARIAASEDDMLALCFEVVCRLLGEQATSPEHIRGHLQAATQALRSRKVVAIHLHPDDLLALRQEAATAAHTLFDDDVQWVADPSIEVGGCILRSDEGGLDARFETQLDRLRSVLKAQRRAVHSQEPRL